MFGYTPTPQEMANSLRAEFDPRSPKLRLSVMAYMLEHEVRPSETLSVTDFIETIKLVTDFVASDLDGFIETISELPVGASENPDVPNPDDDTGFLGNSYL